METTLETTLETLKNLRREAWERYLLASRYYRGDPWLSQEDAKAWMETAFLEWQDAADAVSDYLAR